jgi:activating signal cointegrator complex subunit 1
VIDPRRLHLTLGVMSLEDETVPDPEQSTPPIPRKTVTSALALLTSLKPHITSILSRSPAEDAVSSRNLGVQVPLNHLDVFPPGSTTGSSVLFLGPDMSSIQQRNSRRGGGDVESRGREGESEEVRELRVLWDVAGKWNRYPLVVLNRVRVRPDGGSGYLVLLDCLARSVLLPFNFIFARFEPTRVYDSLDADRRL